MNKNKHRFVYVLQRFVSNYNNSYHTYQDCAIDLNEDDYCNGRTFFAYDFTSASDGLSPPKHGNVKIELKFRAGITVPQTVYVYTETQAVLHIDNKKNVFCRDYTQGKILRNF